MIDMVLAYQQQDDKGKSKRKLEVFEKHLKEEGLEIETEHATVMTQIRNLNRHFKMKPFSYFQASQDHKTSFMKIHAPNIVLERYADIVNMQKPIKVTIDILSLLITKLCSVSLASLTEMMMETRRERRAGSKSFGIE